VPRLSSILVAFIVVVGCAGVPPAGSPSGSSASPSAPPASATPAGPFDPAKSAWDNVLARIGPDGEVDAELAMDAFAAAFSPLPGRAAPPGELVQIDDGTLAVQWLQRFWGELTEEQQAYADALIRGQLPAGVGTTISSGVARAGTQPLIVTAAEPTDWPTLIDSAISTVATRLGRVYTGTIKHELVLIPIDLAVEFWHTGGWADSRDASGGIVGPAETCTIYISPWMVNATGAAALDLAVHEVFHCFDYDLGQIAAHHAVPAWVKEGAAMWAGQSVAGQTNLGAQQWTKWLLNPGAPLFGRSYDAIGIYGLLESSGVDPWSVMDEILLGGINGNAAAFGVLVTHGGEFFLDTWGTRYWDNAAYGPLWTFAGAGFAPSYLSAQPSNVVVENGSSVLKSAPFRAASAFSLDALADVVLISSQSAEGIARVSDAADAWQIGEVPPLCTREGGCLCPEGSAWAGVAFADVQLGSSIIAGVSGEPVVGLIKIEGFELPFFCQNPKLDPCLVGTWVSDRVAVDEHFVAGGFGMIMTIAIDGTTLVDYDLMSSIVAEPLVQPVPEVEFTVEMSFSGTASGKIAAWDAQWAVLSRDIGDQRMSFSVFLNGDETEVFKNATATEVTQGAGGYQPPGGMNNVGLGDGTYECVGNFLRLIPDPALSQSDWHRQP
jgi:hypothetical protein